MICLQQDTFLTDRTNPRWNGSNPIENNSRDLIARSVPQLSHTSPVRPRHTISGFAPVDHYRPCSLNDRRRRKHKCMWKATFVVAVRSIWSSCHHHWLSARRHPGGGQNQSTMESKQSNQASTSSVFLRRHARAKRPTVLPPFTCRTITSHSPRLAIINIVAHRSRKNECLCFLPHSSGNDARTRKSIY